MQTTSSREPRNPPIVDYRIVDAQDGAFELHLQRVFDSQTIIAFAVLALFVCFGLVFASIPIRWIVQAVRQGHSGLTAKHGPPICCAPFFLIFMGFWFRPILLGIKFQIAGLKGREIWLLTRTSITPPSNPLRNRAPLFAAESPLCAGHREFKGRPCIAISTAVRHLTIGPFLDNSLAQKFEQDLRDRRPEWFTDADGSPIPFAIPASQSSDGALSLNPIVGMKVLENTPGHLTIKFYRRGKFSPHGGTGSAFLLVWLCGWSAGEFFVGKILLSKLITSLPSGSAVASHAATQPTHGKPEPILFLCVWFVGWTVGGLAAMRYLVLNLRRTEAWSFDRDQIVAKPTAHHISTQRIAASSDLTVRFVRGFGKIGIEFTSEGNLLYLGAFKDELMATKVASLITASHPHWALDKG